LEKDLDVAARDATIVLLAAMGGPILKDFNAGAILYKRLSVLPCEIGDNCRFVGQR